MSRQFYVAGTMASSLDWKPISEPPTRRCGWFAGAILPVNHDSIEIEEINAWRAQFGFAKVWYNQSSTGKWWEATPDDRSSRLIGVRMTHWAELPTVPRLTELPNKTDA